jgi:uncharacterized cupredoxin-like copper-binding protein
MLRRFLGVLLVSGLVVAASNPSSAAAVIKVSLTDLGATMEMPTDLGMAMGGDMSKATMAIAVDNVKVPAGDVTFEVTNDSKEMLHEMLVAPVADLTKPLPYVSSDFRVDEEASKDLGEVSELDPGKSGSLTINLTPGTYILFCNVAGHYMAGMWTLITVE